MAAMITISFACCVQANAQDDYLKLADECFEKGDYECAKKNYTLFQTWDGRDMSAQIQNADECLRVLNLADDYFKDKEYEKAKDRYQIVLERNPKDRYAKSFYDFCEALLKRNNGNDLDVKTVEEEEAQEQVVAPVLQQTVTQAQRQSYRLSNIRYDEPTLYRQYRKGHNKNILGAMFIIAGGILTVGGVSILTDYDVEKERKDVGPILLSGGIVCLGAGIPLFIKGLKQKRNAANTYRRQYDPALASSHFQLNMHKNGLGFAYVF